MTNTSSAVEHVEMYPAGAAVIDHRFTFAGERSQNEMTSWVAADPPVLDVPAQTFADVTIQVRRAVIYTTSNPNDLTAPTPVVTAAGPRGDNAAITTWNPTSSVNIPGSAVAGVYTCVVTQSVLQPALTPLRSPSSGRMVRFRGNGRSGTQVSD